MFLEQNENSFLFSPATLFLLVIQKTKYVHHLNSPKKASANQGVLVNFPSWSSGDVKTYFTLNRDVFAAIWIPSSRKRKRVWSAAVLEAPDSKSLCSLNLIFKKKLSTVLQAGATMGNNQKESHNIISTCTQRCGISREAALTPLEHAHRILSYNICDVGRVERWGGSLDPACNRREVNTAVSSVFMKPFPSKRSHDRHKPLAVPLIFCL